MPRPPHAGLCTVRALKGWRMNTRKLAALVVLSGVIAGGRAGAAPSAYALQYRFKVGQSLTYRMQYNVQVLTPGRPASQPAPGMGGTGSVILQVAKINPGGGAVVSATTHGFVSKGMGPKASFRDHTALFTVTNKGELLRGVWPVAGIGNTAAGPLVNPDMFAAGFIHLPNRPVKVGDTWQTTRKNIGGNAANIKVTDRLVSVKTVRGEKVARIEQSFVVPLSATLQQGEAGLIKMNGRLKFRGTATFGINTGRSLGTAVKGGGAVTMAMSGAQAKGSRPQTLNMKIDSTMSLIK